MDIIGIGDFSITNFNQKTCMSFRIPSLHEIDYVNNGETGISNIYIKQIPFRKINTNDRNAPCHCGSGKKFKHCHGAQY